MDTIITGLADYSALGLFAGFLAWQFIHQQKQIQEMMDKTEAQTDKVRDRYDKIITSKDELYAQLSGKLESDIDHIRTAVDKLLDRGP
jgi:predicted  nucleic acid-binding Zn-ribbon protein